LIGPKRDKGKKVERNFRGHFKPELIKSSTKTKLQPCKKPKNKLQKLNNKLPETLQINITSDIMGERGKI
jgi:hypothetical protein